MIRRFIFVLFLLALVVLSGYNAWQMRQMQEEIGQIQANVKLLSRHHAVREAEADGGPALSDLDLADLHVQRAQGAMARGDFGTAQSELTKAVDDVRRTAAGPADETRETVDHVRHTLSDLQAQAAVLWQKLHGAGVAHSK